MEFRTLSGRTNAWSRNTTYANAVEKHSEVGSTSCTRSHTIQQELSKVLSNIDNQQRSEMQLINMNKKTMETSMSAYSEKMRRISLERESMTTSSNKPVTSPKDRRCMTRRWSSMTQIGKPNEMSSAETKNTSGVTSQTHTTSSESDLTRLADVGSHSTRRKISDTILAKCKPKNDASQNKRSPVRCTFDIVISDEAPMTTVDRLHNDCHGKESESSMFEITPFPSYRESSFYQRRMRSSRLRFAQSEYTDRTEKISRKIRPKYVSGKLGSMRFRKPLWKPRGFETGKAHWKRTVPPKPPPKPYHQIFRYSDAVKDLLSCHDSNSTAGSEGGVGHANAILTVCDLCEDDSPPLSSGVMTSISSNSLGSMVKHGQLANSPDAKSVQFKLPLVQNIGRSRGLVS